LAVKEQQIAPPEALLDMYRSMVRIRRFEDNIHLRFLAGTLPGTVHLYQGEEAVAVGVCSHLRNDDVVASTHRPHGHAIAKGMSLKSIMAELYGKEEGCCRGKGGSMHIGDPDVGMLPAIAIVGGGLTIATGCALAFKLQKKDNVAVSFFGDGASNEGDFHEALNMAAIWNLPVVYVCENNLYGASTRIDLVCKLDDIADRAASYGMPSAICDGNDVLAVHECAAEAIERARTGGGPTLIECKTYRMKGHSRSDANAYRDKEEEKLWFARDPLIIAQDKLKSMGALSDADVARIDEEIEREIDEATQYAEQCPLPASDECFTHLWA
jgi:acetoin:2,6-dichlorophenolindophenol oxidoreductase subunit alpha